MSIALRAAQGSNNAGGGTSLTLTKPTGVVDGDVVLAAVTVRGGSGTTISESLLDIQWSQHTGPSFVSSTHGSTAIGYGNGLFVAGGYGQALATSSDGIAWTDVASNLSGASNAWISKVKYANSIWMAVSPLGEITTSPDGSTWTKQGYSGFGPTALAYGAGVWVMGTAVGGIFTSADNGVNWTPQTSPFGDQINDIAYNGSNLFVAVGNGGAMATSPDGITWTSRTSSFGTDHIWGVAFGNSVWVATGAVDKIASSSTGTSWTQRTSPLTGANGLAVAYGDRFVILGSFESAQSTDGTTWSRTDGSSGTGAMTSTPTGLAWSGSLPWVASCDFDQFDSIKYGIATGDKRWTQLGSPVDSTTTLRQAIYWRVSSSEPGSTVFNFNGTQKASGEVIAFSGAETTLLASSYYGSQANGSNATVTSPALSFSNRTGIELMFAGTATGTTQTAVSPLSEPTNGESASTSGSAGSRTTTGVSYAAFTGTAPASRTATMGSAAVNIGHHIFVPQAPFLRTTSDSVTQADSASQSITPGGTFRTTTDSVTQGDSASRVVSAPRTTSDSFSNLGNDAVTRTGSFQPSVTDSVTIADSPVATKVPIRSTTDSVTSADAASRAGGFSRTASDSSTQGDAPTRSLSAPRSSPDSVTSADAATVAHLAARSASDTLTTTDSLARTLANARTGTDSVTFGDSAVRTVISSARPTFTVVIIG